MTDRYEGKPFLRLLDSYVLDAIDGLDPANRRWLTEAEPHFRATFGEQGTWRQIVERRMRFPPGMPDAIRETWEKGRVRFLKENSAEPDKVVFAHMFVDQTFPH
ncbi:hypothetical protein [Aurantiacibacter spongiae]|uniref:Uncharacterized protein n=1 Tax=Aurantiacibacter spongiae TaxID=2488860 RepID=A0A3N5DJJ5_9SPHN|nr:hypothetical protein [Aurantiacibacter spongiae]RPF70885.1 hypothetical protein EG799_04060 [Aurantiacibacter spongiae]